MKTIAEFLPRVKANRYTYYNLDKQDINLFKKKYNKLLKNRLKTINDFAENLFEAEMALDETDFLVKLNAMNILLSWMK